MQGLRGILFALLVACQPALIPPPSDADARGLLSRAVELAHAGDLDGLCAIGGGNCERLLADAGNPPEEEPWIIGTRTQQPTETTHGGVVLEICGRDDSGDLYYSEMLVSTNLDGELFAIEPVYWAGITIAEGPVVGGQVGEDLALRCA